MQHTAWLQLRWCWANMALTESLAACATMLRYIVLTTLLQASLPLHLSLCCAGRGLPGNIGMHLALRRRRVHAQVEAAGLKLLATGMMRAIKPQMNCLPPVAVASPL